MKNSTPIILICVFLCTFNSQGRDKKYVRQHLHATAQFSASHQNNFLSSFTPFYSEDFSGGLPAGWQVIDSAGIGIKWHYTTTGTENSFYDSLSVSGTSASNGYMIYDSDSAGQSVGGENAELISSKINCSAHSTVHLTFNEFLMYYNDTATVLVSNDGNTWTAFHNSSVGLAQYESTPNPNHLDIDISSVAANQDSVYIRFNYRADYSFFWMIDDVQLYESPTIDGSITGITAPANSCTLLSSAELVTVTIYNSGGDSIADGFDLTYSIDGGTPVTEQVTDTIAAGSSISYSFNATADLSVPGNHTISAFLTLTGDTIASNDSFNSTIFNGPYVVNTTNVYGNGFESSDDLSGFATEDNNGDSITWHASNLFPYAGNFCAQLSSVTADDWYFTTCLDLDSSIVYNIKYFYRTTSTSTNARFHIMIGQGQTSSNVTQEIVPQSVISNIFWLPASTQFSVLSSGTYYVGLHVQTLPGDSLVGLLIDNLFIGPDSGVGIAEANYLRGVSVYPNPSSGKIILNAGKNQSKDFDIEIMNSTGEMIYSEKSLTLNPYEIDLSESSNGLYFVRVKSGNFTNTQKISILR